MFSAPTDAESRSLGHDLRYCFPVISKLVKCLFYQNPIEMEMVKVYNILAEFVNQFEIFNIRRTKMKVLVINCGSSLLKVSGFGHDERKPALQGSG